MPLFVALLCLGLFLYEMRFHLFLGTATFAHDNLYGAYAIFHYFAKNVLQGVIPLWDPYSTGGVPFFPLLGHVRLLDPVGIFFLWITSFFTRDTVLLYQWTIVLLSLVNLLGIYLLFQTWFRETWVRLSLIPFLFFSYLMIGAFRQPGLFLLFMWVPYIVWLFHRIVLEEKRDWRSWILFSLLIGITLQGYCFAAVSTTLLFFVLGVFLFHREKLTSLFTAKLGASTILLLLMATPTLSLLGEADRFIYPLRMFRTLNTQEIVPLNHEGGPNDLAPPANMPYSLLMNTHRDHSLLTLASSVIPDAAFADEKGQLTAHWRAHHDGHLFLGIVVLFFVLTGIFWGSHPYKKLWLFFTGAMCLLYLGPSGGVHRLLYEIYFPPMRYMRLPGLYILPLMMGLLYFFCLGMTHAIRKRVQYLAFIPIAGLVVWGYRNAIHAPFFLIYVLLSLLVLIRRTRNFGPIIFLWIAIDFGVSFRLHIRNYLQHHPLLSSFLEVSTQAESLSPLPLSREVAPPHHRHPMWAQASWNIALLFEKSYAFAPPFWYDPASKDAKTFEEVHRGQRWSSYFLHKNYFQLIHSEKSDEELKTAFAMNADLFQFKKHLEDPGQKIVFTPQYYSINTLRLSVELPESGYLYWADGYDERWQAWAEGRQIAVVRASENFKAIALKKGGHEIEFRYRPWGFIIGLVLFYATFGVGLATIALLSLLNVLKVHPLPSRTSKNSDRPIASVESPA